MMDEWEREFREKLEREVPEGLYKIGESLWTGKGGFIDFEVEMRKEARGWSPRVQDGLDS